MKNEEFRTQAPQLALDQPQASLGQVGTPIIDEEDGGAADLDILSWLLPNGAVFGV